MLTPKTVFPLVLQTMPRELFDFVLFHKFQGVGIHKHPVSLRLVEIEMKDQHNKGTHSEEIQEKQKQKLKEEKLDCKKTKNVQTYLLSGQYCIYSLFVNK